MAKFWKGRAFSHFMKIDDKLKLSEDRGDSQPSLGTSQ